MSLLPSRSWFDNSSIRKAEKEGLVGLGVERTLCESSVYRQGNQPPDVEGKCKCNEYVVSEGGK
jgi:hypothetical protein